MSNKNLEILFQLNIIRKKIDKHVDHLFQLLEPFFDIENQILFTDSIQDIQKINENSLLLKKKLAILFNEQLTEQTIDEINLSEHLSKIRHDFRNNINIILGYAEMTLEEFQKSDERSISENLQKIIDTGHLLSDLIDQLTEEKLQIIADLNSNASDSFQMPTVDDDVESETMSEEFRLFQEHFKILLIDDIEENCQTLKRYLKRLGYKNISMAFNGFEALSMIKENGFDLVLLDIDMPLMSGIEVLLRLKEYIVNRQLHVVMISGSDTMENILNCIKLGAEDFLSKPFNSDLLRVRIGSCLEKKWFTNKENLFRKKLEIERRRYAALLQAIFPPSVVTELFDAGQVKARSYKNIAILFVDIVGFTKYCETHDLHEVIISLQEFAEMCENVATKHHLQKIKTIGDSFLAIAGMGVGVERNNENPVINCINCAEEILSRSKKLASKWEGHAGIDYGSVIGGIIGHRQFLFDIWGDTVNTAARIQSLAEPNKICLTKRAWEQARNLCFGQSIGMHKVKGKDPIEVFQCAPKSK